MVDEYGETLYESISHYIEQVRTINSDMRKAADEKIESLQRELEDVQSDLNSKSDECDKLERDLTYANEEIEDQRLEIEELKEQVV